MDEQGDGHYAEALGRAMQACRGHLMRHARRMIPPRLRSKVGASDLVQEAFVDAQRKAGDLAGKDSDELRAWLYRVMVLNLSEQTRHFLKVGCADVRREARLEASPPGVGSPGRDRIADGRPTPATEAIDREAMQRLAVTIEALPPGERQVILLRYWERLDYAEIGLRMGRSAEAARKVHARACRRLSGQLAQGGPIQGGPAPQRPPSIDPLLDAAP